MCVFVSTYDCQDTREAKESHTDVFKEATLSHLSMRERERKNEERKTEKKLFHFSFN